MIDYVLELEHVRHIYYVLINYHKGASFMGYEKAYHVLFNEITEAIALSERQTELLKQAHLKTEEMYMSNEEQKITRNKNSSTF